MKKTILLALATAIGFSGPLAAMENQEQDFFNFDTAALIPNLAFETPDSVNNNPLLESMGNRLITDSIKKWNGTYYKSTKRIPKPDLLPQTVPTLETQALKVVLEPLLQNLTSSNLDATYEKIKKLQLPINNKNEFIIDWAYNQKRPYNGDPLHEFITMNIAGNDDVYVEGLQKTLSNDDNLDLLLCCLVYFDSQNRRTELSELARTKTYSHLKNVKNASEGRKQIIAKLDRKLFNYTTKGKLYNSAKSIFNNHRKKTIFTISALASSVPYIAHDLLMPRKLSKYTEYLLLACGLLLTERWTYKVIDLMKGYFDNNPLSRKEQWQEILKKEDDYYYINIGILIPYCGYGTKQIFELVKASRPSITNN